MTELAPFELESVLASRTLRVGWALSAGFSFVVGFVPLLGGPRYEAALVAGLVVPAVAAVTVALDGSRTRCGRISPLDALLRGLLAGALHLLVLLGVAVIHGFRAGFCEPTEGLLLFVLGPGMGAVLGGLWGAVAGVVACGRRRRRLLATLLALGAPLLTALFSLVRFITSPIVFAYDPFVGYFAGPLYEVVQVPVGRLLTYRAGTVATGLALLCAATLFRRVPLQGTPPESPSREEPATALRLRRPLERRGLVAALLFAATSLGLALGGKELGHFSTTASIRQALGAEVSYGRCDVVYDESLRSGDVLRLARECDAHLGQLERYFETSGPERVTVMLFASAEQKGRLMGAASTYIAKPWRREVYLQPAGFPHPVLGHELAHVVAGAFGAGPFRVAGPLGGLIPDPGRIEGVAVASAPRDDGDVDLEEWAAAMRQVKLLPPLGRVFRLTFLGESSARAYTVAGAFMAWLREERGAEVVRRWYGGESLETLTGESLAGLEARWHAQLDRIVLPEQLLHEASARFERPAIFGRQCPHLVDRLYERAQQWLGAQDPGRARQNLSRVLELDPSHPGAALLVPACTLREGKVEQALEEYRSFGSNLDRSSADRARAWEGAGDAALLLGEDQVAFDAYTTALDMTVGEHARRTLEVKRWALRAPYWARRGVSELLVGSARKGAQWDLAAATLGRWMQAGPESAMARYLLGKNLLARGHFAQAATLLESAAFGSETRPATASGTVALATGHVTQGTSLPLPSVRTEALRSAFIARCALADPVRAGAVYRHLVDESLTLGQRRGLARIAERCDVPPGEVAPRPGDPTRPPG
jgi:tetratricopeptide (TPR) repeat protein